MPTGLKVVVGLGKTGLSCVKYLYQQGHAVAVTDSRANPPGLEQLKADFPDVPIKLGQFDLALMDKAEELIVSPGVPVREAAIARQIARGVPAIGDIELFVRHVKTTPIIGITGSNGKSTVTTLVGQMAQNAGLNVKVGGNLGTPALDLMDATADLYVLELSSFQLETTYSLQAAAATVLNISPDHLDRYPSLAEYIAAKQRIFQNCQAPVINREDIASFSGVHNFPRAISFGLNEPKTGEFGLRKKGDKTYLAFGAVELFAADRLKIKGRHQLANALAALALGTAVNLPHAAMLQALQSFTGLAHRCQWVEKLQDVDWYNDSKGTNVYSTLAAIEGLGPVISGKLVLIAGGLGKQQDFSPLRKSVAEFVRTVVLIGQDAAQIAAALEGATHIIHARTLEQAVLFAKDAAQKGDAVLLSPACASYDMFRNFEHRGEVFMAKVKELAV